MDFPRRASAMSSGCRDLSTQRQALLAACETCLLSKQHVHSFQKTPKVCKLGASRGLGFRGFRVRRVPGGGGGGKLGHKLGAGAGAGRTGTRRSLDREVFATHECSSPVQCRGRGREDRDEEESGQGSLSNVCLKAEACPGWHLSAALSHVAGDLSRTQRAGHCVSA